MEFEPSSVVWKSRGKDAALGASVVNSKEGSKLVLVTTQSEVVEYCTQARKCVNHWTFRPGSSAALRLAAVRNPVSQAYFGVRATKKNAGEALVSWKQSELDVNKWKRAVLTDKSGVFGLYVHPQLPEDVVVVYENGHFECYDDALTQVFDSDTVVALNEDVATEIEGKVVWASLASNHRNPIKGALLLSLLVQSKTDTSQYELLVFRITPTKERRDARIAATLLTRHSLPPTSSKTTTVVSCAFHAETLSYSIVLSTGDWHMVYFRHDALSHSITFASSKKITTFAADLSDSTTSTPVQKKRKLSNAGAAGSAQFVVGGVGPFSYLVVGSPVASQKLVAWDSKFGVHVGSTEVKMEKDGAVDPSTGPLQSSIGQVRSLVSSLNGEIIVATYDHAVFMLNVKNKHSSLASVLGVYAGNTNAVNAEVPALPNSSINWEDVANSKVEIGQWQQAVCSDDAQEQELIAELVEPTGKVTAAAFQKKFDATVQKLGGKDELSYRFLMAVTRKCIESADSVALWGPLKVLLQSKRLSARAIPTLLPSLIKHNQFELLELALTSLTDIDERSIVRLLRFFIRKADDKQLEQYVNSKVKASTPNGKRKSDNQSVTSPSERYLVALLGMPTNSVFLHHAIRELQLSEVLFLLAVCKKHFYALVEKTRDEEQEKKLFFTALPTSTQFCAWICALIDGHVAQLVLTATKDSKVAVALQQLDALVTQQLTSCENYEGVQGVLDNFLSGVKLPQAHGIPDYSIEELVI